MVAALSVESAHMPSVPVLLALLLLSASHAQQFTTPIKHSGWEMHGPISAISRLFIIFYSFFFEVIILMLENRR